MKTASAQLETEVVRPEPELSVVSSPGYSGVWELAADGIYRYVSNGNYYYRPLLANGKRAYRSLKTQNLKLAKERYQALGSQNGPAAESKLKVGDILDRYEKDGYLDVNCEFRRLSDRDSNFCRTAFQFQPDTVPIHIGQCSGVLPDGFWAPFEWCPTGLERCPAEPVMVSDRDWNLGRGGVERRGNGCQGSRSIQVNRERHLMARTKLTMRQIQEILRLKHQNQLSIREIARSCGLPTSTGRRLPQAGGGSRPQLAAAGRAE